MNILITGGAGFIGRHLVNYLIKNNHSVTIFDNLSKSSEENIAKFLHLGAKFVKRDITNYDSILRSIDDSYDAVVHLAAKTRVIDSIKNPEVFHRENTTGSFNVLQACVKRNVKKIVCASSGAVYGDSKVLPLSEDLLPDPISPYGVSKVAMEYYLKSFSKCYGLNGIALRFSNVYGQGQSLDYAGVITKFIDCIKNQKSLTIFGDGESTRDFVNVNDVVQAIYQAIKKEKNDRGSIYNIATGKNTSIKQLAELLLDISKSELEIIYDEPRKGEIKHNYASIDLAEKELNYHPQVQLKDGLEDLLRN